MLEMIMFALGLDGVDEPAENDDVTCRAPEAGDQDAPKDVGMPLSQEPVAVPHDAPEGQAEKMMEPAQQQQQQGQAGLQTLQAGQRSAPASPCVTRKIPQTLNLDSSKIPQPLASPTPLRRSGSLRLRGEKQGFGNLRIPSVRGHGGHHGPGARPSPGSTFPSITEAAESWKKSLRGSGDGPSLGLPLSSDLRHQRHHRSLQSLSSRTTSRDAYPHTPTPSPEDLDLLRPQNLNRFLLDHAKEFSSDQDDLDSLRSYGSNCSTQSACDHAQFGRNGTTFSGRRMKYIVHCSSHPEPNEYLTPTQRANQQIRRLKALVEQARKDIEMKDEHIFKLTKEMVDLKLLRDEVDGSPAKSTGISGDSSVCRVTTHLENECGNSTSLSDSGHFDDVLSVASPLSTHSPSPRQLKLTAESERQAEIYQRKIDDVNRKHGEKSVEDRKSLVDMYEKKMEEMSRKANESLKQEKNDLIEMYEKRIEDIVRRHQEKIKEDRAVLQESYSKQIEELSLKHSSQEYKNQSHVGDKKLEDVQKLLQASENRVTLLHSQLEEANARLNDLQQELFQSRESTVLLEEDVENLQKKITSQEQQLAEKQIALVQSAQFESELQVLRRHLEGQEKLTQQMSLSQSELAEVQDRLKDTEDRYKKLECEKFETEARLEERLQSALAQKSHLEGELSTMVQDLKEMKNKLEVIEREKVSHTQDYQKLFEIKCKAENEFAEVSKQLQCLQQTKTELEHEKENLQVLFKDEEKKVQDLKIKLETKSDQIQRFLSEESQKKQLLEDKTGEIILQKENEYKRVCELVTELERELTDMRNNLSEEHHMKIELENWKINAQEEMVNHVRKVQDLSENSECLKKEISELKISLEERCKSQEMQDHIIEELGEKLNDSQSLLNKQRNEVHSLTERNVHFENELKRVSELLEVEKKTNCELLQLKRQAANWEAEMICIKQNLDEKTQQLQYFVGIENEVAELKQSLVEEREKVQELLTWKSKALNLEEELKSLKEESPTSLHKMHLVNAISEDNQIEATNELPFLQLTNQNQLNLENPVIPIPYEAQQHILELETEIQKLRENLYQSYWNRSEEETLLHIDMEKSIAEQTLKVEKLENEIVMLNQCIASLREENSVLISLRDQHMQNTLNDCLEDKMGQNLSECQLDTLPPNSPQSTDFIQQVVCLHNGTATENDDEIVSHLKKEIESLRKALSDQEERHTEMNLKMYLKGQEAAKFERKDQLLEMAVQSPEKVSIPELLSQLAETEKELEKVKDNQLEKMPKSSPSLLSASEAVCLYLLGSFKAMYRQLAEGQANSSSSPEATLLFLKSAVYYFLTDEANCQGHLHAIQSILGFTEAEKQSIDTLTYIRR